MCIDNQGHHRSPQIPLPPHQQQQQQQQQQNEEVIDLASSGPLGMYVASYISSIYGCLYVLQMIINTLHSKITYVMYIFHAAYTLQFILS